MNLFILSNKSLVASGLTPSDNNDRYGSRVYQHGMHAFKNVASYPDRHVVKMILESAQIIITAIHIRAEAGDSRAAEILDSMIPHCDAGTCPSPCTGGHKKHPVIKWASLEWSHIEYVRVTLEQLCIEYKDRYGRNHAYAGLARKLAVAMYYKDIMCGIFGGQPQYFPLCANSPLDTKQINGYIKATQVGLDYMVAAQRLNFIINKPWAVNNYKRGSAVGSVTPDWYRDIVGLTQQCEILRSEILKDSPTHIQYIAQ